jgi:hypothetical protein
VCYYSCIEENSFNIVSSNRNEGDIAAARQWLEQQYGNAINTRTPGDSVQQHSLVLDWEHALTYKKGHLETVEIPIKEGWDILITDEATTDKLLAYEKIDSLYNQTRLVIATDRKESTTNSFIMTFVGSYSYLTSAKSLRKNSYLKCAPDFDGSVLYYEIDGLFANGWVYKHGKIRAALIPEKGEKYVPVNTRQLVNRTDCYAVWTEIYYRVYIGSNLYHEYTQIKDPHIECYESTEDDGFDIPTGGLYIPGLGGGSGSSNDPTNTPCAQAASLNNDTVFRARINELLDSIFAETTEYGWIKTTTGEIIRPSVREEKSTNYSFADLNGKKITEMYHMHPSSAPLTSWSDLCSLANQCKLGRINYEQFSYGIISQFGSISMAIVNIDKFKAFMEKVGEQNAKLYDAFYNMASQHYRNGMGGIVGKLSLFLEEQDAGVELLFQRNERQRDNIEWANQWKVVTHIEDLVGGDPEDKQKKYTIEANGCD